MSSMYNCTLCDFGTYQTGLGAVNSISCTACGGGTFQSGVGAVEVVECKPCSPGTYQTISGGSSCIACSARKYQDSQLGSNGEPCTACLAGTYQPRTAATAASDCMPCAAGQYQERSGMSLCVLCSAGSYLGSVGASSNTSCAPCDLGMYSDVPGASTCVGCKDGTFQSLLGSTVCLLCPAGTFRNVTNATTVDGTACTPCAYDTWSGDGSSACTCNAGFVPDHQSLGSCIDLDECAPGVGIRPACASTTSSTTLTCVNTPGSFYCSGGGGPPAKCGDPLPSSCPTSGGGTIYVSVEGIPDLSSAINATLRLDGSTGSVEVSSLISGALLSFVCPPSKAVGTVVATVLKNTADAASVGACTFFMTYNPPAASVLPLTIPITGGRVTLSLSGYDKLVGNGAVCFIRQVPV